MMERFLRKYLIFITSAVQNLYFMKKYVFFNTGLILIPEVFICCKVRGRKLMNSEFMIHLFIDVFK